jgi:2-methylisocitrate lyase-like PEP mutase family enzyme
MSALNNTAKALRALHVPGKPLLLANVYDAITARAVASLPACHALATTSGAVAAAAGVEDNDMDMETNLRAVQAISKIAKELQKPLTVDFQSGYGDELEEGVERLINYGVVGLNLEDVNTETKKFYDVEEAASRVHRVMQTAITHGVSDFVVNARVDTFLHDGPIEDAIKRGKAYLAAGAFNIFVLGGPKRGGVSDAEIKQLTEAFDGKLNVGVKLSAAEMIVKNVTAIGVARCSIGSQLRFSASKAVDE